MDTLVGPNDVEIPDKKHHGKTGFWGVFHITREYPILNIPSLLEFPQFPQFILQPGWDSLHIPTTLVKLGKLELKYFEKLSHWIGSPTS